MERLDVPMKCIVAAVSVAAASDLEDRGRQSFRGRHAQMEHEGNLFPEGESADGDSRHFLRGLW